MHGHGDEVLLLLTYLWIQSLKIKVWQITDAVISSALTGTTPAILYLRSTSTSTMTIDAEADRYPVH